MQFTGSLEAMAQLPSSVAGNFEDADTVATIAAVHSGIPLSYEPSVLGAIPPRPQVISRTDVDVHCTDGDLGTTFQPTRDQAELEEFTGHEPKVPRNEIITARRDPSWRRRAEITTPLLGTQEVEQQPKEGDLYGIDLSSVHARVAQIQRDIDDRAADALEQTPPTARGMIPDSPLDTTPSDEKSTQKPDRYQIGSDVGDTPTRRCPVSKASCSRRVRSRDLSSAGSARSLSPAARQQYDAQREAMRRQYEIMQSELAKAQGEAAERGAANQRLAHYLEAQQRQQQLREEELTKTAEDRVDQCRKELQRRYDTRKQEAEIERHNELSAALQVAASRHEAAAEAAGQGRVQAAVEHFQRAAQ